MYFLISNIKRKLKTNFNNYNQLNFVSKKKLQYKNLFMKKTVCNSLSVVMAIFVLFGCQGNSNKSNASKELVENSSEELVENPSKETLKFKILSDKEVAFQLNSDNTNLTWMRKNLELSTFRNGDPITEARTAQEWVEAGLQGKPVWCYYNNDPKNGEKYGKMYNWYAVNDPRELAPKGWHIAKCSEWDALESALRQFGGGDDLKSKSSWEKTIPKYNYPNIYGFSAVPGGYREGPGRYPYPNNINYTTDDGEFIGEGNTCLLWLFDDSNSQPSYTDPRTTSWNTDVETDLWAASGIIELELSYSIEYGTMGVSRPENMLKWMGLYVRCVKD